MRKARTEVVRACDLCGRTATFRPGLFRIHIGNLQRDGWVVMLSHSGIEFLRCPECVSVFPSVTGRGVL